MRSAALAVCVISLVAAPASYAANVNNPYGNIDRRNDAGNDTGDSQVDALNEAQLNRGAPAPYAALRQQRVYPPRRPYGYPPQGYAPQPYAQPGYPQAAYAQPGYPPQGYPPPGYPTQGYPTQGYPPPGYAPYR